MVSFAYFILTLVIDTYTSYIPCLDEVEKMEWNVSQSLVFSYQSVSVGN